MAQQYDCIVCGSCVADAICRPVQLNEPLGGGQLHHVDPVQIRAGGITCNSGVAMAGLGLNVGIFSYLGQDPWGLVLRQHLQKHHVDDRLLMDHPTMATSSTVVLVDSRGERSFLHSVGAPKDLRADDFLKQLPEFANSKAMLFGYYSLNPQMETDLPSIYRQIHDTGCMTAMDAAGDGGSMNPLQDILPYLDIYVPSLNEATNQTGETDPRKIIEIYRRHGGPGVLGVKLGIQGVLISDAVDRYVEISAVSPPGEVVDTTGAGDNFLAGLITGIIKGWDIEKAGRLGAATAAVSVTKLGGSNGVDSFDSIASLAGL